MADQGNSVQHNVQNQSQGFGSMAQPGLGMAQVAMSSEQAAPGRGGDGLGALAPIFPPQNFEVPDISFSNSVSPNADFNRSLFSAVQMFSASSAGAHYADVPPAAPGPAGGQQQGAYFPPPSNSPPGTSSSDDSDDLPLAQLAKRAIGSGTGVGSPSGLGTDTTSLENSPLSGTKKPKAAKKKKKKDPNEPQKPVSAYALFFRDTQATIKGHNPNASFGEVSKIVASMWDQLDPEHKDVYKKKTETAKKQYLKQLAAYRASQVSQQSAADESESSPSPPSVMSGMANVANSMPQALHSGASSQPAGHIPTAMSVLQQQMMMPHHQAQMQQLYPQMAAGQQGGSPSPPLQQRHSPVQQQQSSPPRSAQAYSSPPHGGGGHAGPNSYHQPMMDNNMYGYTDPESEMELTYPSCVRSGCGNYAKENPSWDSEYCSNDCVISHCRDIFTKWVASRTDTNSFPVK